MSGTTTQWPFATAAVNAYRWQVLVNGTVLSGCEEVSVHHTNHRAASTFTAKFALDADPGQTGVWFDADPPIMFEVQIGTVPTSNTQSISWTSVFVGEINDINLDPPQGSVEVSGRDLMGRLIDARISEAFANQTSSEIAQTIAGLYGLTADVDKTDIPAGDYYQQEHDHISEDSFTKSTSPNELLLLLAQQDGFDYWVDGTVLHYKQPMDPAAANVLQLSYNDRGQFPYPVVPVSDIRCHRSLVLDKGIVVIVKTWQHKSKSSHEVKYPPGAKKDAHENTFVRVGWSQQKALAFAQATYADNTRHQRTVDLTLPGELQVKAHGDGSIVSLSGAPGTSFNIQYWVDEVILTFNLGSGFQKHIVLKNQSPQSGGEVG